jgi:hypothetical protein
MPSMRFPTAIRPCICLGGAGLLVVGIGAGPIAGQTGSDAAPPCEPAPFASPPLYTDSVRFGELIGTVSPLPWHVTRSSYRARACRDAGGKPTLTLLPFGTLFHVNSDYPSGGNDGLLWAGRGASILVRGGARASWGPISAALAPEVAHQENAAFDIIPVDRPNRSEFAWYWTNNIDWPQRFGPHSYGSASLGESYVRADIAGFAAGLSTERMRWGPMRRYPVLMSGTAPGFPHAFVGTSRPRDIWLGRVSLELIWGRLQESEYFDTNPDNDDTLLAGLVAAFQPAVLPGLSLGFMRSYLRTIPPEGFGLGDYLTEPYTDLFTNTENLSIGAENQLLAFFARWVFPESGFEVYGEVARDDFWDGLDDLLQEPEHSMGIALGLQKLTELRSGRHLRVAAEAINLNFSETQRSRRTENQFYTHAGVQVGYTHRGQLLGAPVGPMGDGQYLAIDVIDDRWMAGIFGERVRYANDIYWQALAFRYTTFGHDVELTGGVRGGYTFPRHGVRLSGSLGWSGRYNRGWVGLLGPYHRTFDHNLAFQLMATWDPGVGL